MRIPRILPAAVAALVVLAACGPSSIASPSAPASPSAQPSVLPQIVSSEIAVGPNRIVYAFLDPRTNAPLADPDRTADVRFVGPSGQVVDAAESRFVWAVEGQRGVYVTNAELPAAGPWRAEFTTAAKGAASETIAFTFDVREDREVVGVGEPAPSVDTPTVDDVGGDVAKISTDTDPDRAFYETSVADALAAGDPFVLVFATPKFCRTAQCGPTLDRVKTIAAAHPDITFINVEPYELHDVEGQLQPVLTNNDLTPVEAVRAWKLLSEPYVFVVDGSGTVTASFEMIFDEAEIDAALDALT